MTQIVHMLRTKGDMSFGEITEVVPWDILAHECGQDLDADQVANPRCFKSHEPWETIPKGARYIYVARHPLDAFVSFYHFLPDYDGLVSRNLPFSIAAEIQILLRTRCRSPATSPWSNSKMPSSRVRSACVVCHSGPKQDPLT